MVEMVIEFSLFILPKHCLLQDVWSVPRGHIQAAQPCSGSNASTESEN